MPQELKAVDYLARQSVGRHVRLAIGFPTAVTRSLTLGRCSVAPI
jgi:hypothetical protein